MKTVGLFLLFHLTNGKDPKESSRAPKPLENILKLVNDYPRRIIFENFVDPSTGLKQPLDLLELNMKYPKTEEEKRYYLKTNPLSNIQFIEESLPPTPVHYYDPKKEIKLNKTRLEHPALFDFESLQAANFHKKSRPSQNTSFSKEPKNVGYQEEEKLLSKLAFQPEDMNIAWTTCDEFKKNCKFHPKDLLKIDWIPFYMWSLEINDPYSAVVHKFSVPTVKTVEKFKKEYRPYITEKVDWNQPMLMLEGTISILLIAADNRGMFYGIKEEEVPDYIKTHPKVKYPVLTLRMKIVDPYLALMSCDDFFAEIMAIKGQEPETDELKIEEAKVLKFTGKGFPVSLDPNAESNKRKYEEWKKAQERQKEESKFLKFDYDYPRDKYLDRWLI